MPKRKEKNIKSNMLKCIGFRQVFTALCSFVFASSTIFANDQVTKQCRLVSLQEIRDHTYLAINKTSDDFDFNKVDGYLALYEYSGPIEDFYYSDTGSLNFETRQFLCHRFYEHFGDFYDYIVILTDFDYIFNASAFAFQIANDVQGIGLPLIDNTDLFSSNGSLKGLIELGNLRKFQDQNSLNWAVFQETLLHEIGHSWLAHVRYERNGSPNTGLLKGDDFAHWSYLLDSDASYLYGNDWTAVTSAFKAGKRSEESGI